MNWKIRVFIINSLHQNRNREEVKIERSGIYLISLFLTSSLFLLWCKKIWINVQIILLFIRLYFGDFIYILFIYIRLYWFRTKRTSVCFQINRKMVIIIWFQFDLIRFLKKRIYVYLSNYCCGHGQRTNNYSSMFIHEFIHRWQPIFRPYRTCIQWVAKSA